MAIATTIPQMAKALARAKKYPIIFADIEVGKQVVAYARTAIQKEVEGYPKKTFRTVRRDGQFFVYDVTLQ